MKKIIQSLPSFVHSVIHLSDLWHWSDLSDCLNSRICRIPFVGFVAFVAFVGLPRPTVAVDCTVPISGSMTISSSCSFAGTTNGVDAGTGTTNTAALTINSGTLTISAGQTVAAGSLIPSGGSIAIISGGQIKPGSPLWAYDADADGYPKDTTMAAQLVQEAGFRRRNLMTSMTQRDCRDFYGTGITCDPATMNMTDGTHSGAYQEASGTPAGGYRELPKDNSTVGLWHMNEASGTTVADSSGNANTGTATGTTVVAGRLANARSFNGTSDYVSAPNSSSLNITGSAITMEAWIYPTADQYGLIINKQHSAGNVSPHWGTVYVLSMQSGKTIRCGSSTSSTSNALFTTTETLSLNTWSHVACTYDGNAVRIYINGKESTTGSLTGTIISDSGNLYIGARTIATTAYFAGTIDEVRISNVARTPEEIKANAQRKPYASYIGPVNDLTQTPGSWSGLNFTAKGMKTADGETPASTTNLVAAWNLNETSGTTAASGGTCGASCNGTLTNFASTASQDQAAGTGWTSANRRWGAGALMFDGGNDYINVADNASLDFGTGAFSYGAWVKTSSSAEQGIVSKVSGALSTGYHLRITGGQFISYLAVSPEQSTITSPRNDYADGNWHYVMSVRESTTSHKLYVDGILVGTNTNTTTDLSNASYFGIGLYNNGLQSFWKGVIDSVQIYSRALSAAEILANYQAGNIEFQTRTSADNATWEAWKPTTNETALDSSDSLSPVEKISQTSLTAYWKLDETSGSRADSKGTNTLTDNNTVTYAPGRLSNAAQFTAANSEYLSIADNADLSVNNQDFTITAWVYADSFVGTVNTVVAKFWGSLDDTGYWLKADASVFQFRAGTPNTLLNASSFGTLSTNTWYFVVAWVDSVADTMNISVNNGVVNSASFVNGPVDNGLAFEIGAQEGGARWDGRIDEVAFWKRTLTAAERTRLFEDGLDLHGAGSGRIYRSADTATKIEGTAAEKLQIGAPQVDANTVGLWHLEETSGTGAYIKDATANANHGTPTGTTVVDGFYGKARSFDANGDYIEVTDSASLRPTTITVEAWIKTSAACAGATNNSCPVVAKSRGANLGSAYRLGLSGTEFACTDGYVCFELAGTGGSTGAGTSAVNDSKWHYIVGTYDLANIKIYVDGVLQSTTARTAAIDYGNNAALEIAAYGLPTPSTTTHLFNGTIDEVRISNTARTAEEIAEAYRAGRDHRLTKTISSKDLSNSSKLPYYIAADRPGTYLETTIGESALLNNFAGDPDLKGYWPLDENSTGAAAVTRNDYSGNGNNLTDNNTVTSTQGKIGKAADLERDNTEGFNTLVENASISTGDIDFTTALWVNMESKPAAVANIIAKTGGSNANKEFELYYDNTSDRFVFKWFTDGVGTSATATANSLGSPSTNTWYYIVAYHDSVADKIGISVNNGSVDTATANGGNDGAASVEVGQANNVNTWDGKLDEIIYIKRVLTADERRQMFEIGKRTHPVTIDFVTSPQAAYTSGTSVTINNPYGTTALTSTLSVGDTMIFKENVGGTETVSQATVNAVANTTTTYGTVTLAAAPTFPTGGYTTNATVFKWQREFMDLTGSLASQRDAVTRLSLRVIDGSQGRTVWLDDFRSASYLADNTPDSFDTATGIGTYSVAGASIGSTLNRYIQTRSIFSSWDPAVSATLTSSSVEYGL